jgi:ubiquinone/menaquinone biosynthesis C-methylase UbiE
LTCVDIGGGTAPADGYLNLDPVSGKGEWKRRIQDGIPLLDRSAHAVRASHVLEHVPAGQERIDIFNEAHRVLVPGGTFEVIVPLVMAYGQPVNTWHAWADPTHCSYWVLPESFHYFDGVFAANADYRIKLWETKSMEVVGEWEGHWIGTPRK